MFRGDRKLASANIFFRRVVITFALILLIGILVLLLIVYLPMNKELEKSLLHNFIQMSQMNHSSLSHTIDAGVEGGKILASRTVIKNAIIDYMDGEMDLEELRISVQPKYEDAVIVLDNLVYARRMMGNLEIAHYFPDADGYCIFDNIEFDFESADFPRQRLILTDCEIYLVVVTPIMAGERQIAYDVLVYDISLILENLERSDISSRLISRDELGLLKAEGTEILTSEDTVVYRTTNTFTSVIEIEGDIYSAVSMNKEILMAPIKKLQIQMVVLGVLFLVGFLAVIHFHLTAYARRELIHYEKEHGTLKRLAEKVNEDVLTGAGSRIGGHNHLESSFYNFLQGGSPLALMMIDIDNFKGINDSYGHTAGDLVLVELVNRIGRIIRANDLIFRWGGDEFIGVFEDVNPDNIFKIVQKIFEAIDEELFLIGSTQISITISVGISFFKAEDQSYEDALMRADKAMYEVKKQIGNAASLR